MKVYKIHIDSAKRQPSGHEYDFEFDIPGLATARDLKGTTWMAAVEWNDPVKYFEVSPIFAKSPAHPATLFLIARPTLTRGRVGPALPPTPFASSWGTRVSATTDAAPRLAIVTRRRWELSSRAIG
jgi:hypothetical protein